MPRRVVDYAPNIGLDTPNLVSSLGYVVMFVAVIVFLVDVGISLRRRVPAGDNPWDAYSLEWATSSPPPEHNFHRLPRIRSERPTFDMNHPEVATTSAADREAPS
jgi:heme/copper-type cytochrome/quinol oxidase subunit 1